MKSRAWSPLAAPGGDSHPGERTVDFGEAVQATAHLTFPATDKKIKARLVVRVLNVERGYQYGSIEE